MTTEVRVMRMFQVSEAYRLIQVNKTLINVAHITGKQNKPQ